MRLIVLLALSAWPLGAAAQDVTGTWLATGVPYEPWTFQLVQEGTTITGTMEQSGAVVGQAEIYDGTIEGNAISITADSPDGARAITFTGTVNGDEIVLNRLLTRIITQASQGGTGLFGTNAAPQVTIRRGADQVERPEPFGIVLLPGYEHVARAGIDSRVGSLTSARGFEVDYDIGALAGNYAANALGNRLWMKEQVRGDLRIQVALTEERTLYVSFTSAVDPAGRGGPRPQIPANFYAAVETDEDIAEMLMMVMGYAPQ